MEFVRTLQKTTLANQITLGRLALAILFFILLSWFDARHIDSRRTLLAICFWIFLISVLADVADGLAARMLKQVTAFGRILDPLADKVLICGAFVYFSSRCFWNGSYNVSGVAAWMPIVILMRELLISSLRSDVETTGAPFPAAWAGKVKMFVQSFTICFILFQLGWKIAGFDWLRHLLIWLTLIVTVASAYPYLLAARHLLEHDPLPPNPAPQTSVREATAHEVPSAGSPLGSTHPASTPERPA